MTCEEPAQAGRAKIRIRNGKASVMVLSLDAFEKVAHDAEAPQMDLRLRTELESYAAGERGTTAQMVMGSIRKHAPVNAMPPGDGLRVVAVI